MSAPLPTVSIVLPVYNEAACLEVFIPELIFACKAFPDCEIIAVDDGSSDRSPEILRAFARADRRLKVVRLRRNSGQSAAMWVGFRVAKGEIVAALDADGQNAPEDLLACVQKVADGADVCCGYRENRRDTWSKRIGSRLANRIRGHFLHDNCRDTGCSLKAFRAVFVKNLQYWHGMHRFFPALCKMQGATVCEIPVHHRARMAGASKYTNFGRLKVTIRDMLGVAWLTSRSKILSWDEE